MASRALIWIARVGTVAVMFALLAVLTHFPMGRPVEHSLLRLAWRMAGAQIRLCRELEQEELLRLPAHMRQPRQCEDHVVPYRLSLRLDGETRLERVVLPRGAKSDRPIYVSEELSLVPGRYRMEVRFEPDPRHAVDEDHESRRGERQRRDGGEEKGEREGERSELQQAIARAPRFDLTRDLVAKAGRIVLVELDESARELRLLGE
jgi:hypothetical protein